MNIHVMEGKQFAYLFIFAVISILFINYIAKLYGVTLPNLRLYDPREVPVYALYKMSKGEDLPGMSG